MLLGTGQGGGLLWINNETLESIKDSKFIAQPWKRIVEHFYILNTPRHKGRNDSSAERFEKINFPFRLHF
jgi:hypothetical protein